MVNWFLIHQFDLAPLNCHWHAIIYNSLFPILEKKFCFLFFLIISKWIFYRSINRQRFQGNVIVLLQEKGGFLRKKNISHFGVVAMETWLELSICKLIFCILPLANISLPYPPSGKYFSPSPCPPPSLPLIFLSLSHITVLAFKAPIQLCLLEDPQIGNVLK